MRLLFGLPCVELLNAKIDPNSRQKFILKGRFSRESCRTRRDLQLSLENLYLRMKFCLHFPPILVRLRKWFGLLNLSLEDLPRSTKIDQNSKQNFILSPRFPLQSCRSRRDLQLSLGNLWLRMKFCLEILVLESLYPPVHLLDLVVPVGVDVGRLCHLGVVTWSSDWTSKTLNKTSSSGIGFQGKVVRLNEIYNFAVET